jgi:hypothetical protein
MSKVTATASSSGIGFFGLLTIVFIVMKLAGIGAVAQWSWLWVLSPLWLPTVVAIIGVIIAFIVVGILANLCS